MEPLSEAQVIANLRQTEDVPAQYYAAWWLGKMRSRHPQAVTLLLDTLSALSQVPVDPERRGVALNAIRALGMLQDAPALSALLPLLSSSDYSVREEAARSLGLHRATEAVGPLCHLIAGGPEQAGREQPGSALLQEPCEAILEALGAIGVATPSIIETITQHPRPLIRAAACRALLQITGDQRWASELEQLLLHPEPLVRRGALLDLGATGWTASLPAIEAATVESSLKLVALRGLAEQSGDSTILDVMDRLL
jgi:phycocyanobilin lyase alpha subunit